MVIGKAGKVIRKLTRDVATKYNLENPQIDAQEVKKPELNAQMMASRLAASIERVGTSERPVTTPSGQS